MRQLISTSGNSSAAMPNQRSLSDAWLIIIPLLVTLLIGIGLIALNLRLASLADDAAGTVVAVFPTSKTGNDIFNAVLQADGRLVNSTLLDSAWLVHSDTPGFVQRLKSHGAWAVFNPSLFQPVSISGCFIVLPDTKTTQ